LRENIVFDQFVRRNVFARKFCPPFDPTATKMSGADVAPAGVELKGWAVKFNSYTKTGRANVSMATFGAIGAIVLYKKLTKKA